MKRVVTMFVSVLVLLALSCGLVACSDKKGGDKYGEVIVNGGFEDEVGALPGWETTGQAFGKFGVVNTTSVNDITVGKAGNNFFSGYDAGSSAFTGTLTSTPFVLSGTGKIGYRIGGGQDATKCYIEFIDHSTNEVLLKKGNDDFNSPYITAQLIPNVVDLSAHIGKTVVIKATDDDKTRDGYGYLNLDDFKVLTEEEAATLTAERTALLEEIGPPTFSETETDPTIKNGSFEDGLNNWLVLSGDAFNKSSISPASKTFFGSRVYNAVGEKFLDGYNLAEKNTGAIRSTKFTLGGDGYISLLIGGAKNNKNYVAICDASDDSELIKITCDHFKDPEMSLNLMRKFVDAHEHIGKVLYVKIVDGDNRDGDFAAINVDDIRVSLTAEQTKELVNETYLWAQTLEDNAVNAVIRNYYNNYDYPFAPNVLRFSTPIASKAIRANNAVNVENMLTEAAASYGEVDPDEITTQIDKVVCGEDEITENFGAVDMSTPGLYTVHYSAHYQALVEPATFAIAVSGENDVLNGDFETGNLAGWTVVSGPVVVNDAVTTAVNGWSLAPYNKHGAYLFEGTSAVPNEGDVYALKSETFTLGGSGIVSFRMGGRGATLRIYDAATNTKLIEYKNTKWADISHPHVEDGCRNLTMTAYYADLSGLLGASLYVEIADTETSGWGVAHFDEIVMYYPGTKEDVLTAMATKKDTVTCGATHETTDPVTCDIAWEAVENTELPTLVMWAQKIGNKATGAGECDLTAYLTEATVTVVGEASPQVDKAITKVSDGTDEVTTGFTAFTLTAGTTYTVTYTVTYTPATGDATVLTETFTVTVTSANSIINGDFETGNLTGWTIVEGDAFANVNVFNETTYWTHRNYNQQGNYHLDGWQGANEAGTGTIRSSTFTLGGTGKISFRLGGHNGTGAYISVKKADGTEVARFTNTKQRAATDTDEAKDPIAEAYMYIYVFDLTSVAELGDELYIELVDNATSGWGLLFVDDIQTYHTDETLTALGTKDTDWFDAENKYTAPTTPPATEE